MQKISNRTVLGRVFFLAENNSDLPRRLVGCSIVGRILDCLRYSDSASTYALRGDDVIYVDEETHCLALEPANPGQESVPCVARVEKGFGLSISPNGKQAAVGHGDSVTVFPLPIFER